jgi:hypothetical protein
LKPPAFISKRARRDVTAEVARELLIAVVVAAVSGIG